MDFLRGLKLLSNKVHDANKPYVEAKNVLLSAKIIVYLFGISSSAPCEQAVASLKRVQEEAKKKKVNMEIIYVSSDTDEKVFLNDFKKQHGFWYALQFGDSSREELRLKYGVNNLPSIVVVRKDGTLITTTGFEEVQKIGVNVLVTWT